MEGYIVNTSHGWTHAMKRAVGPGGKIPLSELYEQYGVKHGLKEGSEFVEWLNSVKLKNNKKWKIVVDENKTLDTTVDVNKEKIKDNIAPPVKVKTSIEDIVNMSVRQAREKLVKITDLNLLKYALQEANQLAGKDSLCNVIRKRIKDLQIGR